jgi:CO dehydrogenase/acetyl-CoA synthase alpha subunit
MDYRESWTAERRCIKYQGFSYRHAKEMKNEYIETRDKLIQELQNLKVETVKDVINEMELEERIQVLNNLLGVWQFIQNSPVLYSVL